MNTIPTRFRPVLPGDRRYRQLIEGEIYAADEVNAEFLQCAVEIIPGVGPEPMLNVDLNIHDADIQEVRAVIGQLMSWMLIQETRLATGDREAE
ncbi:hypothetical protein [Rothia halotolerans]|uniref:hypothetical protein n=1 Tax=Rothia halotolerans TaxID=405770 RepID=UPI00101D9EBB|nr:hypothetical protein [Rothia halotolerans]